jgi:hypothetical protein
MTMLSRIAVAGVLATAVAVPARAQDPATCPMHAAHTRRGEVDLRHDAASGVAHEKAVHRFLLAKDGGSIQLEAVDAGDLAVRARIREHLQVVARSFAAGDFALPMTIHAQVPPGTEVMKQRKDAIRYAYEPTAKGGVVRITTRDAKARAAVHAFLRFQVDDHGTNDPAH